MRKHTDGQSYVLDLHAKIPYHSMEETEREEIWDDGLHFTPKGYERMGGFVAERLIEIISELDNKAKGD
jgi:lysophospholipase L1-like esterase